MCLKSYARCELVPHFKTQIHYVMPLGDFPCIFCGHFTTRETSEMSRKNLAAKWESVKDTIHQECNPCKVAGGVNRGRVRRILYMKNAPNARLPVLGIQLCTTYYRFSVSVQPKKLLKYNISKGITVCIMSGEALSWRVSCNQASRYVI